MWQSALDQRALLRRAGVLADIRDFFKRKSVIEIDVPVLGARSGTDPHLSPLCVDIKGTDFYLQTSPEFFLKRLLCSGVGSIYYLGKAFRDDEIGTRHNPEFTMLEWYREGFDDQELMREVSELITSLAPNTSVNILSYAEIFTSEFGINPHVASADELAEIARQRIELSWQSDDRNTWLDLLFSHFIEPELQSLTFIYDYPASQCALAKVMPNDEGIEVAKRFEVFWKGIELANGYWELTDPMVQRARFQQDLAQRQHMGSQVLEIDEKFLQALEHGMPECAGVALGVERLLMCLDGLKDIDQTMAFSFKRL